MTEIPSLAGVSSRVAYVARSRFVAVLIKLVSHLFPSSQHRLFFSRREALAWLQLSPASPEAP